MFKIKTMNNISPSGIEVLTKKGCTVGPETERPEAMLIRSAELHGIEFNPELLAIARAGAGYNNIPVEECAEKGIVVFNSPGANAEAVKELELCSLVMASRDVLGSIGWVRSIAGRAGEPGVPLDHGGIVPVRHEADVLTVRLGGVYKALRLCQLPHLLLPQPTQRKQGVGQLLLGHGVEHVALILACVQPLFQQIAPVLLFDPGVMPGGDILAAQNPGPLHQLFKFHISVAVDAGIGGDAGPVAFNKFVHHLFGKGILEVEHIVGHPQPVGHAPGVLHILQGAAAAPGGQTGLPVVV